MKTVTPVLALVVLLTAVHLPVIANGETSAFRQAVIALNPVGFWPADDGAGEILHDHSGNDNHGRLLYVSWENGLLDFTGAYQWAEITDHESYQSRKSEWGIAGGSKGGISLCRRRDGRIDIVSGGKGDALGSRADSVIVETGVWQHVLYTYEAGVPVGGDPEWQALQDWSESYEAGTGMLYVNGQLAQYRDDVPFERRNMRFLIGPDALWWLQANYSGALDGSVRDLVMFDRVLSADEVGQLYGKTRPSAEPYMVADDAIVLDGREITLAALPSASEEGQRRALEHLEARAPEDLQRMAEELEPLLVAALERPRTRRAAASLLMKLDNEGARQSLTAAVPLFTETLRRGSTTERVESALALTEMGSLASDAIPPLVEALEEIIEQEGARVPRIEDLLRNTLMQALLQIAPEHAGARDALGAALARPILESVDLSQPYMEKVRPLVEAGRYMDALDVYRELPLKEHDARYISQGAPLRDNRGTSGNSRAYTAIAQHGGYTYKLGAGVSFDAAESVSDEDFRAVVAKLEGDYPKAADWMKGDTPRLCRVKIYKTDAVGNEQTAYLEGEHFIFDGRDAKVRGWSVAIDSDGYIHVTGGMHNAPNQAQYIPGSWEQMGASRDHTDDDYPTMLYWVSRNPGDIESLEFAGQRDNPRNVPAPLGMCYMTFTQDRDDVLYLYGRIHVQGIQSWGLYRYDTEAKRWSAIGGFAPDVTAEFPEWADQNIEMTADWLSLATFRWRNTAPQNRVLAWARQPHFYNYIRGWGIQFDRTNRMHVQVELFGFDSRNRNVLSDLYAYSDDGGQTFHRADGEALGLPLTVTEGEPGYAAMQVSSTELWWDLWRALLQYAGYRD